MNKIKFAILLSFSIIPLFSNAAITPNLILNQGAETVDLIDTNRPQDWFTGSQWGTNIAAYEYLTSGIPVSEISSGNALSITYTNYTGTTDIGGDAKWYFTPVPITSGRQYSFSDSYISDTNTYLTAEFFDANHAHLSFGGFFTVPPSPSLNTWKSSSVVFTAPANAAYMTVFHSIQGTGKLVTDNYSLSEVPLPSPFDFGFVSLTFDDGYTNHYTNVKPLLDSSGLKGTFYIVSHLSGFSVVNPSFEDHVGNPAIPDAWSANTPSGSSSIYPVTGYNSPSAVEVNSAILGTTASWNFNPISVLPDENYNYSEYYKSDTQTSIYIEVLTNLNETKYIDPNGNLVSTKTPFVTDIPVANDWTKYDVLVYLPPEVKAVRIMHALDGIGSLTIDNISLGSFTDYSNTNTIRALQADGLEIGGHTQTHASLTTIPETEANTEVIGGKMDLINGGITSVLSFAYPYGNFNESIKSLLKNAGFTSGRTVTEGFNGKDTDSYVLLSKSVNRDTTVSDVKNWIDEAIKNKTWLILVFHQILDEVATDPTLLYGTTPSNLSQIFNYINEMQVRVLTVDQGVRLLNTYVPPTTPFTPTIDFSSDIIAEATSSTGASVSYTLPISHNGNETLITLCNPISGSMFALGTTTVSCIATNSNNVSASSNFKIVIRDTTAPAITAPDDVTLDIKEGSGVIFTFYGIRAVDSVDGNITPVCDHNSGELFTATSTIITCLASDLRGNSSSKSFKVLLNYTPKVSPPSPTPSPSPSASLLPDSLSPITKYISGGRFGGGKRMYNIFDFNKLIIYLGKKGANLPGDFNLDGVVDVLDFNILVMNWFKQ